MRPQKSSPAHQTNGFAELVCSNSLRSNELSNAVGLLKEEMASLDSLILRAAYKARVPAGSALAVDRQILSDFVQKTLTEKENIEVLTGIVTHVSGLAPELRVHLSSGMFIQCRHVVLATGPLTDDQLAHWIQSITNQDSLYFYDSIAPIVDRDSIDMSKAFQANRYDKGETEEGDYINCPLTEDQYNQFIDAIEKADLVPVHDFEDAQFFDGCLPIEEMVRRGRETLRHGPMKPVGLQFRGKTKEEHEASGLGKTHAVVQLRQDDKHATLYNMVGFQTRMKWGEQKRIFAMIPGLEKADFVRLGCMHRNTYLCSPVLLEDGMTLKSFPGLHFAGQVTGCEGYVESAAVGLYVGRYLAGLLNDKMLLPIPQTTALGALVNHILYGDPKSYQPMNINFGLFPELQNLPRKADRKMGYVKRATLDFRKWFYDSDL